MNNSGDSRIVEKFLEDNNMTYLFLLLANLEAERISNLPFSVKRVLQGKVTTNALEHIAANDIPDYVVEVEDDEEDVT
ncbi:MAG: hypothetical protein DRH89_09710 [Candidatus Cloacimonadota bacterium]|nr:MAG: hypothetical protein DRH89_09710 [Candidatus Cloacimonadota bacterium]